MKCHLFASGTVLAAAACLLTSAAFAHVTIEVKQAPVDTGYKATFRVPHGCAGEAMTRLRIQIPEGVIAVKPMPKAGWTLDTVKGTYPKPISYHGTDLKEGVREVSWRGSLPDDFYDEFVISTFITDQVKPGETLYFPVVQECGDKAERWIEIPSEGQTGVLPKPAPALKLLPKP